MIFIIFFCSVPTLGQIQNNNYHPGYVPSSKPHLPTPRDATFSRPQASETFKVLTKAKIQNVKKPIQLMQLQNELPLMSEYLDSN